MKSCFSFSLYFTFIYSDMEHQEHAIHVSHFLTKYLSSSSTSVFTLNMFPEQSCAIILIIAQQQFVNIINLELYLELYVQRVT